jgi:nicotinamide-nucleotide amidase
MKHPARAVAIATGDEILRGFVHEANTMVIARGLRDADIDLVAIRVVGDSPDALQRVLEEAAASGVELVVTTGGLGPTHDDRTTELVAGAAGLTTELREDALEFVEARVRAYGRMRTPEEAATFAPGNRKQATLPVGALMLEPLGTAPGYVVEAQAGAPTFVVLPGPPSEMRHAWRAALASEPVQALAHRAGAANERVLRAWGVPESAASQALAELGHEDSDACRVTLCARDGELELSIRGRDRDAVTRVVDGMRGALGASVFAVDDERSIARIVGERAAELGWAIATAESCTGGMLAAALTDEAGSSAWFAGSVVSYANEVKEQALGVPADVLVTHGAVSEATAAAMAEGVLRTIDADVAISITGIAGPGGGSDEKPVGTVHLAARGPGGLSAARRIRIPGDRATVRRRTVNIALHMLRELLADATS